VPGKGPLTDWTAAEALSGEAGCAATVLSLAWAMRRFSRDLSDVHSRQVVLIVLQRRKLHHPHRRQRRRNMAHVAQ
jgi:hypothetical protein